MMKNNKGVINMLNITQIINDKVDSMLKNETLKKEIEDTVQEEIISTIRRSISNYDIRHIFENKIKNEVSEAVEQIGFKGYANLVIKNLQSAIEAQAGQAINEEVLKYFKELYMPLENTSLTVTKLFEKYVDMAQSDDYDDDTYAFMCVEKDNSHIVTYSKWVKILVSLDEEYREENSKTYEITLINIGDSENKFKIASIYEDRKYSKNLTGRVKFGFLDSFERFILSAYFNETPFEINESDFDNYEESVYCRD